MKKYLLILPFFLILLCIGYLSHRVFALPSLSSDSFLISLSEFNLGDVDIKGDLHINVTRKDDYSIYTITADEFTLGEYTFGGVETRLIKKDTQLLITYIKCDTLLITGKIDFSKNTLSLNVNVNTMLDSEQVQGALRGKFSVEGSIYKPWIKGTLFLDNGRYFDQMFHHVEICCAGYIPYLRLSESEVTLYDGSRFALEGFINIKDLEAMFSSSAFNSKEVSLNEWKVFSQEKAIGFTKDIDPHMGVTFGSVINRMSETENPGTELRYQFGDDKFLKLRMEENKSIVGFERRHEF